MSESNRNVEHEVLLWATDKLQKAFRSSIKTLAGRFYGEGLLTTEVKRACSTGQDSCVESVVSSLQDRVNNEPPAYYQILEIVKSETGVSYFADHLERRKSEIEEEIRATEKRKETEMRAAQKKIAQHINAEPGKGPIHLQETTMGQGIWPYVGQRPTQLPTFTTAAPTIQTIQSCTAPARNMIATSYHHHSTGPATYSKNFPPTMPFNKQHTSSSTQAGDAFPRPVGSPVTTRLPHVDSNTSPLTIIPAQRKQSECTPVELEGRLSKMHIVTGTDNQAWLERRQANSVGTHSPNTDHADATTMPAESKDNGNKGHDLKSEKQHPRGEVFLGAEKEPIVETDRGLRAPEQEVDTAKLAGLASASGTKKECDRLAPPERSDSTSSIESDSSNSFGTPPVSLTSSIDSRGGRKECSKCKFYNNKLEELENKVSELQLKNQEQGTQVLAQQHHSGQQIESYRQELIKKEQYLMEAHHRHQEMEQKVYWLQIKINELEQNSVKDLEAYLEIQRREIESLKHERDRERCEKEKERLQKEKECAEKEKERILHERERERRMSLEKELLELQIVLRRTKSLQCDEQEVFLWGMEYNCSAANNAADPTINQHTSVLTVANQQEGYSNAANAPMNTGYGLQYNTTEGQRSASNTGPNPAAGQWSASNTGTNPAAGQWSASNTGTNPAAGQWSASNTSTPVIGQWNASNTTS